MPCAACQRWIVYVAQRNKEKIEFRKRLYISYTPIILKKALNIVTQL